MVREIVSILLDRKDTGTLRAHMVRGIVGTFALKVVNTVLVFGATPSPLGCWGKGLSTFEL